MAADLDAEAAKARLRRVGEGLGVASWVREHPLMAVLAAAGIGGLAARMPRDRLLPCLDMLVQLLPDEAPSNDSE